MLAVISISLISIDAHAEDGKFVDVKNSSASSAQSVGSVVDIQVSDTESIRVGVSSNNANGTYIKKNGVNFVGSSTTMTSTGVDVGEILKYKDIVKEEKSRKAQLAAKSYSETTTQGGLVDIRNPDPNYKNVKVTVTGRDREILENLVFGEAGNQGFVGCALVAQAIKDMYILGNYESVDAVRRNCGYSGSITKGTNETAKQAVAYVFDEGGYAVQHRVLYFYAPRYVNRPVFHESQNFIIEYKDHKFFDRWN